MRFTDAQILAMPQRCLTDREYRHAWYRERERMRREFVELMNKIVRNENSDAIDAEVVEKLVERKNYE